MNECINLISNKETKWKMPYPTVFVNIYMKKLITMVTESLMGFPSDCLWYGRRVSLVRQIFGWSYPREIFNSMKKVERKYDSVKPPPASIVVGRPIHSNGSRKRDVEVVCRGSSRDTIANKINPYFWLVKSFYIYLFFFILIFQ